MIDEKKIIETIEKIRAINPEIIVRMINDKPYYSIRYFDLDDCRWHVGYSSYKLEFVVEWLRECFDIVNTKYGWIPVSERLPENDGFYLTTLDGAIVGEDRPFTGLAEFEDGKWIDDEEDYKCVIAWQPLPEPYQNDEQEEIKMKTVLEIHHEICDNIKEVYEKKNSDYGNSFAIARKKVPFYTFGKLFDKFSRYENLTLNNGKNEVEDESVEDTLLDMANYCIMELAERRAERENEV